MRFCKWLKVRYILKLIGFKFQVILGDIFGGFSGLKMMLRFRVIKRVLVNFGVMVLLIYYLYYFVCIFLVFFSLLIVSI